MKNKINQLADDRDKIKKEMAKLNKKREEFVAEQKKKAIESGSVQLENVIIKGLRDQASKKKIKFEKTIN